MAKIGRRIRTDIAKMKLYRDIYFGRRKVVKIHGTLRVGTNYLTKLIATNFDARVLESEELAWKHGNIRYLDKCSYIIIARDPYSWIQSFWTWEKKHKRTENTSLRSFMLSKVTHEKLRNEWQAKNPLDAWNKSYGSWLELEKRDNVVFVRYEDILTDFDSCLGKIEETLGLTPTQPSFINIHSRADDWRPKKDVDPLDVSYYREKKYLDDLDVEDIAAVNENIDPSLMQRMGFGVVCKN